MVLMMSTIMDMEFVHALNPLYAFPIVAVILCAFIVYAFGFKSPVQPPSFDVIDEEKKSTKKRKHKETGKVKVIQNGKLNGNTANKSQVSVSTKKKELDRSLTADKPSVEKPANEKKATKKSKSSNEKKASQEKKGESFSLEDAGEGGWVQLVSKKGRKNRKKDEASNVQKQALTLKSAHNQQSNKSDETILSEEISKADVIESSVPEKKLPLKTEVKETAPNMSLKHEVNETDPKLSLKHEVNENVQSMSLKHEVNEAAPKLSLKHEVNETVPKMSLKHEVNEAVPNVETCQEKIVIIEDPKIIDTNMEKITRKENLTKEEKINEETTTKSKKKKKKSPEVNTSSNNVNIPESSAEQMNLEISAPLNSTNNASVTTDASETLVGNVEEHPSKETKASNVVFDELAGLYPEPKEQRKKKRVRRDH